MAKKLNDTEIKLLNISIYKIKAETLDEAKEIFKKEVKNEWLFVDDLNEKYFVKFEYTNSDKIESLEPEDVHPFDQYELTESIVQKGKDLGLKIGIHQPDTTLDPEAIKKFKELALSKIKKVDKNTSMEPENGS